MQKTQQSQLLCDLERFVRGDFIVASRNFSCRGIIDAISLSEHVLTITLLLPLELDPTHEWTPMRNGSTDGQNSKKQVKFTVERVVKNAPMKVRCLTDNCECITLLSPLHWKCFGYDSVLE